MIVSPDHLTRFSPQAETTVTVMHEGRLQLRVDPRLDGEPRPIVTSSLALEDAAHRIAVY